MATPKHTDVYGQPLRVGDWISYPTGTGLTMTISHAKITGFATVDRSDRMGGRVKKPAIKCVRYNVVPGAPALSRSGTGINTQQLTLTILDRLIRAPEGWEPNPAQEVA